MTPPEDQERRAEAMSKLHLLAGMTLISPTIDWKGLLEDWAGDEPWEVDERHPGP